MQFPLATKSSLCRAIETISSWQMKKTRAERSQKNELKLYPEQRRLIFSI